MFLFLEFLKFITFLVLLTNPKLHIIRIEYNWRHGRAARGHIFGLLLGGPEIDSVMLLLRTCALLSLLVFKKRKEKNITDNLIVMFESKNEKWHNVVKYYDWKLSCGIKKLSCLSISVHCYWKFAKWAFSPSWFEFLKLSMGMHVGFEI